MWSWHRPLSSFDHAAYRRAAHDRTVGPLRFVFLCSTVALVAHSVLEVSVLATEPAVPGSAVLMGVAGMGVALIASQRGVAPWVRDAAIGGMALAISAYGVDFSSHTHDPAGRLVQGVPYLSVFLVLIGPTLRSTLVALTGQFTGLALAASTQAVPLWPTEATLVAAAGTLVLVVVAVVMEGGRRWIAVALWRLERQARVDHLTGLTNRRVFDAALAAQGVAPAALLLVDLDGFKQVNDGRGHAAGDEALRRVAALLASSTRDQDVVSRVGGDEFSAILANADAQTACAVACRLLDAVRASDLGVTCSVGIAVGAGGDLRGALPRADRALYRAKALGGDRIELAPGAERAPTPPPAPGTPGTAP
ncbi:MAG: GGDEF domain-containing protein [Myxococcales bacterium]|nr:GGDEF domain-containing protein [Myxococcales bacterium]